MRKFAVQDATFALMIVWAIGFAADLFTGDQMNLRAAMVLRPELVYAGEWWRLLTFPLAPPEPSMFMAIIFIFFYMLYLTLGRNIEQVMGAWRYNLFLLTVWVGSAAGAMIGYEMGAVIPLIEGRVTGVDYLPVVTSLLFAFATFFPTYTILFMFIVPLQIKWLAIIGALFIAYGMLSQALGGQWGHVVMTLGQCLAYLIFVGPFLLGRARTKQKKVQSQIKERAEAKKPFHKCAECGVTELDDPERRFRMCTECDPPTEYCDLHINNHEHRRR